LSDANFQIRRATEAIVLKLPTNTRQPIIIVMTVDAVFDPVAEKKTSVIGRGEFATASTSPTQNIRQMQNATIIAAFRDVDIIMALGTRLRGCLVSSTVHYVNTRQHVV
jgi:hypothetical protein